MTYTCANCGDENDLTENGGITMGGKTYCLKPDCMNAGLRIVGTVISAARGL